MNSGASRASLALVLSLLTMAAQFAVRMQMTAALGAGPEYDLFLLLMIPATLVAQVGYQAIASALVPRMSDLLGQSRPRAARRLFHRGVLVGNALGVLVTTFLLTILAIRDGNAAELTMAFAIMLAWGIIGGWVVLERQLLVYNGSFAAGSFFTLLPAAAMAVYGAVAGDPTLHGFVYTGLVASMIALLGSQLSNRRHWNNAMTAAANEDRVISVPWLPIVVAALPIIMASFNAQAMAIIDQTMAAWWQVGGLGLLATALAVGRLPHTVAESLSHSLGYRAMLDAVSACQNGLAGGREALVAAFRKLALAQAAIIAPAILFVALFPHEIVNFLFQRGTFSVEDAARTAEILRWLPACALGLMLQSIQVQILVAWGAAATALRTELVLTALSALLNLAFLPILGLPGLIVSTALSVTLVGLFLFRVLQRVTGVIRWSDLLEGLRPLAMPLLAALTIALVMRLGLPADWHRAAVVFVPGTIVAGVFYGCLYTTMRKARIVPASPAAPAVQPAG